MAADFESAIRRTRRTAAALTETANQLAAAVQRAEQLQQLGWCRVCGCACLPLSDIHPWCKRAELRRESRALDTPDDGRDQP